MNYDEYRNTLIPVMIRADAGLHSDAKKGGSDPASF